MSVSISKADGVTMLTMTSDPDSVCPPLCQVLKGLCYSPVCCTVSRHMKRIQTGSLSALGTLQILIGLFNIALGVILSTSRSGSDWTMDLTGYPYWMGGFFVLFGVVCILTEKFPSPCLVFLHLALHLCGVGFAIAAIVLYSINTANVRLWWMCNENNYWYERTTPSPNPELTAMLKDRCQEAKALSLALLRSISSLLIVLSVVELCVVLSAFVFGVKSMRSREEKPKQAAADLDQYQPLLQDAA
ncbi:membrane-spanning 4-domains subfamily A member 6B-like [Salarias fasciatus]|uniref:Membrane-spanning 4-domains subfamily A member 6B-like n=1 Tax=Salarias fasciatus TaxID=181472 RepID=A0A672HZY5_SALFA|nr:membrane-spanning 4-domains subfamily A member 6B-like [Salarias fasciatus]XP_029959139.1 membrane-spanning 4-domains subfamily A member 6B-like [Salarias fasciatus]XP_029959140.1 membrane-spanning 4-domains subfamily A member 6B-like [Salarias fasciatus]